MKHYQRLSTKQRPGGRIGGHIVVAERALGKPLPRGAVVHHVNGDPGDNRPTNLVICQDTEYHWVLHVRERVLAAGGNPDTDKVCSRCRVPKLFSQFCSRRHKGRVVLNDTCRPCAAIVQQERQAFRRVGMTRHELIIFAAAHPELDLFSANQAALNSLARSLKGGMAIDGVSAVCQKITAASGR